MSKLNNWFIRYNNLNLKYVNYTDELTFYGFINIVTGEEYGYGTGDGYGALNGSIEYRVIYEEVPDSCFHTDWCGNINGSSEFDE